MERAESGCESRATFGRVPLFYYLLQWILAHGAAIVLGLVAGKSIALLFSPPDISSPPRETRASRSAYVARVDHRRLRALPALQVVRGSEVAAKGLVDQLHLSARYVITSEARDLHVTELRSRASLVMMQGQSFSGPGSNSAPPPPAEP